MTTKALANSGHDCRSFSMSGVTQVYSAPTPVDSRIAISVTVDEYVG